MAYYMIIETGSVYSEKELYEWEAEDEENVIDWGALCEVWPLVENPDDSDPSDWTDDFEKAYTGRED